MTTTAIPESVTTGGGLNQLIGDVTAGPGVGSQVATLANSGVVAATKGSSTKAPVITVDAKGRVTTLTEVSIVDTGILQLTGDVTAGPGSGSQAATLAVTGVAAASYGTALNIPTVAVDAKGRLTSAANTPFFSIATITSTGTINDLAVTTTLLRCNNASDLIITGFVAGVAGQVITVISVGAGNVFFAHQNSGSSNNNKIINFATSANTPLAAGVGVASFTYDATTLRWRLTSHDQGAPIAQAYSAGDFTASGSMSWTVDSGDVAVFTYFLSNRILTINFLAGATTVGGTLSNTLIVKIPGGFTAAQLMRSSGFINDNGTQQGSRVECAAAGTTISNLKYTGANFAAATDATAVAFLQNVSVQ